jgi:HSP20 family protein
MALSTLFVDPFFTEADREFDRTMRGMFRNEPSNMLSNIARAATVRHAVDVIETPEAFKVVTDAPGFTAKDINVELHEGKLTISGERQVQTEEDAADGKYHVQERHFSKFTRQFQLPKNIMDDSVAANLDKGVLTVTVPKKQEEPKPQPKRIAVMASEK